MRILTGRVQPTRGMARIAGFDVGRERARCKPLVGQVFEHQGLYPWLSGRDNLRLFARARGVGRGRTDELLERLGLGAVAGRHVDTYSLGMRQRLLVARALLHAPRVLLLDEATHGLDPAAAQEVRALLREQSAQGVAILMVTHDMREAEALCDRVAFLVQGRLVAQDTPAALGLRFGRRTLHVRLRDGSEHQLGLDPSAGSRLASWLEQGQVLTLHSGESTLEDVFMALAARAPEA